MLYSEVPNVWVKGIFEYMGRDFPNTTLKTMDVLIVNNYGMRHISPLMENVLGLTDITHEPTEEEWMTLAQVILDMFSTKWTREEEIYSLIYNPDDAYSYESSTVVDDDTSQKTVSSRLASEKEFGFDSDVGSDSSSSQTDNTTDVTNDGLRTQTTQRHGTSASKTKQAILVEELNFRQRNHIKNVIKDVIDELTLKIY